MIFTSFDYVLFLLIVLALYWLIPRRWMQNLLLLVASYFFYGYVHPWFCYLIAFSTVLDYTCGLAIARLPRYRTFFLILSLTGNLGMLGFFKYFNFFIDNFASALRLIGLTQVNPMALNVLLPVGISFYTFQTLSYTIDIYRGKLQPRTNFITFSTFVAMFPQLVAGPIERATHFIPQLEQQRRWNTQFFFSAIPLIIQGYLKKLVIADNLAVYVDKVFTLEAPSALLFAVVAITFSFQIYTDFSAYTDIARGSARLFGFELMENFRSPYLAISPSDFWRRWHISFSSWIRDYLYISLGGSRVNTKAQFFAVVMITMGLSGLWHGAAWPFVIWGIYHGLLVFVYHLFERGGRWQPRPGWPTLAAWAITFSAVVFGFLIFRLPSLDYFINALSMFSWGFQGDPFIVASIVLSYTLFYISPLAAFWIVDRKFPRNEWVQGIVYGLALVLIVIFHRENPIDFIYFQF